MAHEYPAVLDWIDLLEGAASADEAWLSFLTFASRYGFKYGAVVDFQYRQRHASADVLSLTWPDAWGRRYAAGGYLRLDPSVRALAYTHEPYTWAEALEFDDYSKAERNIVFEAGEYGLHSGFIVPVAGARTGTGLVMIAGDQKRLSRRERAELHFAAIYAQTRVRTLSLKSLQDARSANLSSRERECLEWAAMGKSDWEIGEILSISERTAGAHIERAKRKLGVSTRIQAVVIALQSGAISV